MSFSIKLVQNSVRNLLLLEIGVKRLCATVVLLEIGLKTLCVSVAFLQISALR